MLSDAVIDFVLASGSDEAQWACQASGTCPHQVDAGMGMPGSGKEYRRRAVGHLVAIAADRHVRRSVVRGHPTPHSDDSALHRPVASGTAVACVHASSSSLVTTPFLPARLLAHAKRRGSMTYAALNNCSTHLFTELAMHTLSTPISADP